MKILFEIINKTDMKKSLLLFTVLAVSLFFSCEEENVPQMIEVSLDYTMLQEGSMTRSGSDTFQKFFDAYMATKVITPCSYSLTFTEQSTKTTTQVSGYWGDGQKIWLTEGLYDVSGVSVPKYTPSDCESPIDTVSLKFEESIVISKDLPTVNLHAIYDSFMFIIESEALKEVRWKCHIAGSYSSTYDKFGQKGNVFYIFSKENPKRHYFKSDTSTYGGNIEVDKNDVEIETNNGSITIIPVTGKTFNKGSYYYYCYNPYTVSYFLSEMSDGDGRN